MPGDLRGTPRDGSGSRGPVAFRGFRRARLSLWVLSVISVGVGAALHDWASRSTAVRVTWLGAVAVFLAHPFRQLLRFRCPRCRNVFLAAGGWRDFLGLGRILWSKQCGSCALPVADEGPPGSGGVSQSRPV
jgi:hypothetical protein